VRKLLSDEHSNRKPIDIGFIKQNLAFIFMFSASQSKYCSCVIAAHRMIYSFNLPVYLYQLVVTYAICWLPLNKQYHDEVCIMSNQLKLLEFFQNRAIHS
jgi:hypothetical protein